MSSFLKTQWRKIVLVILSIPVVGYFVICFSIGFGVRGAVSGAWVWRHGELAVDSGNQAGP